MRDWKEIPGDFYNWKKTLKPERPYIHDYSKKLTYKIFMAKPTADFSASDVIINYEDAFRHIKEIDAITLVCRRLHTLLVGSTMVMTITTPHGTK